MADYRFIKVFILLLGISVFASAQDLQDRPLTDFEIVRKINSELAAEIFSSVELKSAGVELVISGDSNLWVMRNILLEEIGNKNLAANLISDQNKKKLYVFSESKIRYSVLNSDSLRRDFHCFVSYGLTESKNEHLTKFKNYSDAVSGKDLGFVVGSNLKITSEIPRETSFFDSIAEPLIILSSSGLLVYLLFTIRSK